MLFLARDATAALRRLARGFPVVAVTGPRQSGKTTLVRATFPRKAYVSLEDPDERGFALEGPRAFLGRFARGAILDEIQRAPELFSYLQTRVDERRSAGQFVLTGSPAHATPPSSMEAAVRWSARACDCSRGANGRI